MHDLKLQYFKNSGKWYMDEGYHNEESRLKIPDILYDDLDGMSQLNLRSKVYDMGLSELKSSGLTYMVINDDNYIGYPMMIINGNGED